MDLRHLRTFLAAAAFHSFTRAARSLQVTQAAVSKHIASLETELGVELFERSGRRVGLTAPGRRLCDYARQILDLEQEARRALAAGPDQVQGRLSIAASSAPGEWLLPELLTRFRAAHPSIQVSVAISDSRDAASAVETGRAEVGVVGEVPRSADLVSRPIASDEIALVVAPRHPLTRRKSVSLAQLRQTPLVIREPGSASRRCVEEALGALGLAPSDLVVAMEMNSNEAIRAAVARGLGAAFQSRQAVAQEVAEGRLVEVPVRGARIRRKIYAVTSAHRVPGPALHAFLDFIGRAQRPARKAQ